MLRSWRSPLRLALLGEAAVSARQPEQLLAVGGGSLAQRLAVALAAEPRARSRRIRLAVDDGHFAIAAVPWQPQLQGRAERYSFARAWLTRAGLLREPDALHVEYRHPGAAGLAYALPATEIEALNVAAGAIQATLERVVPVSALQYAAGAHVGRGLHVLLNTGPHQMTALVRDHGRLLRFDAEPLLGGAGPSARRLLARLRPSLPSPQAVAVWGGDAAAGEATAAAVRDMWDLDSQRLALREWTQWL